MWAQALIPELVHTDLLSTKMEVREKGETGGDLLSHWNSGAH